MIYISKACKAILALEPIRSKDKRNETGFWIFMAF